MTHAAQPTQTMLQGNDVSGVIFHMGFDGSAFIFPSLKITSWPTFTAACLITSTICLSERYLTYLISTKWTPTQSKNPVAVSLFRSALYWVVTLERLVYMLIAMSFHAGLILVTVTSLTIGQFIIELQEAKHSTAATESYHPLRDSVDLDNEPYTDPPTSLFPFTPTPRSAQPEISRFRTPVTEAMQSSLLTPSYRAPPRKAVAFELPKHTDVGSGNGRERAREIMGQR
ncbi:Ctr domain protein [Rhizoctonia solani 123E]|uniref:Ctr domain protein n=1 Tax=Rhizoctonia solani 123E TaxID=1423351 RepID=A0A074S1I6_9AGAM|nr:Ctr domain protein [Rhizoctonia solani 123E]